MADGLYGDLSADLATTILDEAGRFANDAIAPLNRVGDAVGARFQDGGSRPLRAGTRPIGPGRMPGGTRFRVLSISAGRACRSC